MSGAAKSIASPAIALCRVSWRAAPLHWSPGVVRARAGSGPWGPSPAHWRFAPRPAIARAGRRAKALPLVAGPAPARALMRTGRGSPGTRHSHCPVRSPCSSGPHNTRPWARGARLRGSWCPRGQHPPGQTKQRSSSTRGRAGRKQRSSPVETRKQSPQSKPKKNNPRSATIATQSQPRGGMPRADEWKRSPPPAAQTMSRKKPGRKPLPPKERRARRSAAIRRAMKKWRKAHRARIAADRNEKKARLAQVEKRLRARRSQEPAHAVVTVEHLQRPYLKYLDADGFLHTEKEISAEQLIALFERGKWRPL